MRKKLIYQKGSVLRHFYQLKDFRQETKVKQDVKIYIYDSQTTMQRKKYGLIYIQAYYQ